MEIERKKMLEKDYNDRNGNGNDNSFKDLYEDVRVT